MPLQQQLRKRLGPSFRRWVKRLDHPDIRNARLFAQRLRSDPMDVLHLGASESQFTHPDDADPRTLPQMFADALAPELSTYSIAAPGTHFKLYQAYLEILARYPVRPIVVLSFPLRLGYDIWEFHPEHGHEKPLRALLRIPPHRPPSRFHTYVPLPTAADYAHHDAIQIPTVDGLKPYGDIRRQLKNPARAGLDQDQFTRLSYAFLHSYLDPLNQSYLDSITAVGACLRDMNVPVVLYWVPIPLDRADVVLGPQARERAIKLFATMEEAWVDGYGPDADHLRIFEFLKTEEFLDADDGIEHFRESGRRKMADQVAEAVLRQRAALASRSR